MRQAATFALATLLTGLAASAMAQSYHYENGYTRQNGTYVEPHYQTNPDSSRQNNWSTQGNVNPFTGQEGTRSPYGQNGASNPYPR